MVHPLLALLLEQSALLANRTGGMDLHHVLRASDGGPGTDPRRPAWSLPLAAAAQSWVRKRLRRVPASVRWGGQAAAAFDALRSELMPPAPQTVSVASWGGAELATDSSDCI